MNNRIAKWNHTTKNGVTLYCKLTYDLGGYNQFTYEEEKRGYTLHVQRVKNEFKAFKGLEDEAGATRLFIKEVSRKSNKASDEALTIAMDQLEVLIKNYNL